jgi:hypothetical protein
MTQRETQIEKGYIENDVCNVCGKSVLTEFGIATLDLFVEADQSFDGGEFSGSTDYYDDFCPCSNARGAA